MAFKLGNRPLPGIAHEGNIDKKFKFKIERKDLGPNVMGEAYHDRVVIDDDITPNSIDDKKVIAHEAQHVKDLQSGRADFGDDYVRWEGKTFARKSGKIKYNGQWLEEGDKSFPWEAVAEEAESNVKKN